MQADMRPYKVWTGNRQVKKSITAGSLWQLIEKGCSKLNLPPSSVRIVLEEDGTEVDDEDYLAFLPDNSTLMFLTSDEKWTPRGHELTGTGLDETDRGDAPSGVDETLISVVSALKGDISKIITLSSDELQALVDCEPATLAQLLGETERFACSVQAGCQRHLDDRQQTTEAVELLRLYHTSQQVSPYVDDKSEAKKRKVDQDS